eukprot:5536594-Pyramimonas_sp.AAC.1
MAEREIADRTGPKLTKPGSRSLAEITSRLARPAYFSAQVFCSSCTGASAAGIARQAPAAATRQPQ